MDNKTLFGILKAANYLDVKGLLELCCKHMAEVMKGKTVTEIKDLYGLTPKKNEKDEAGCSNTDHESNDG